MKVATIVVTYNRKNLLKQNLLSLLNQSRLPDRIFVVDNASVDGTEQMVIEQFPTVTYIGLRENSGLFGGLNIGMNKAYQQGFDAVWLMDDDAIPKKDALEKLLKAIKKEIRLKNACVYCASVTKDERFFAEPVNIKTESGTQVYLEFNNELRDGIFECEWGGNVGMFIPRQIIDTVGFPRAEMYFCGEGEYISRIKQKGFSLYRYFGSIIYHEQSSRFKFISLPTGLLRFKRPFWKKHLVFIIPVWRDYYITRNKTYVYYYRYNSYLELCKYILFTFFEISAKLYYGNKKISRAFYLIKALYDGFSGNLGKIRIR